MNDLSCNALFWSSYIRKVYIPAISLFAEAYKERLLSKFDNLNQEAEQLSKTTYQELCSSYGDGESDLGGLAEHANDTAITWYSAMEAVKQSIINLHSVGLRHLFEQQLYDLVSHAKLTNRSSADYKKDLKSLSSSDIDIRNFECWQKLEELRLVSNTVKHAEGGSSTQLRKKRPDLFAPQSRVKLPFIGTHFPVYQPMAGDDVYLTSGDLTEYTNAVLDFWAEFKQQIESK